MSPSKRTPLNARHRALGGRMVDFAGWEMPVQYEGILAEHRTVRTQVGLFDVSHMGEIEVRGPGALATCQRLFTNDVARLHDGRAQYGVLCLPDGGVIDDVILYRLGAERFLFCVNAGNREADFEWMHEHRDGAEVVDRSDELAQIAVQGPRATTVLARLTEAPLAEIPSFAFVEERVAGRRAIVAHTGYTGEDGWEVYCAAEDAGLLWDSLLEAGEADGLRPAGLGARDTLRLEAALALYGHELTREITPLEARLGWVVRFEKEDFIGRDALLAQKEAGPRRRLVGLALQEAGIPRPSYRVLRGDRPIGEVTSGTKSPTLGYGIALAYVDHDVAPVGMELAVEVRGRPLRAETVKLPFYKREAAGRRAQGTE